MKRALAGQQPPTSDTHEQLYGDVDALAYSPACESSHPVRRVGGEYEGECPEQ